MAPGLRTLVVETRYGSAFAGYEDLFATLSSLECLHLHPNSSGYDSPDAAQTRQILDALPSPPSLRQLSVGTGLFSQTRHFVSIISHPALSILEELAFPFLSSAVRDDLPPGLAIELACEARGVRVNFGTGDKVVL